MTISMHGASSAVPLKNSLVESVGRQHVVRAARNPPAQFARTRIGAEDTGAIGNCVPRSSSANVKCGTV